MRPRQALFAMLVLAGLAAPACALILGAEELPEAMNTGAGGIDAGEGDAAPDHASDADAADDADAAPTPGPCDCPNTEAWAKAFACSGDVTVAGVAVDSMGRVIIAGSVSGTLDVGGHLLTGGTDHDVFVIVLDSCGEYLWAGRFGDGSDQSVLGVTVDPASSPHPDAIVITGAYSGTLSFGGTADTLTATHQRAFVARLDPATGAGIASLGLGSDATQSYAGTAVVAASDGSAFWTGTEGNAASLFVRRLDPSFAVANEIVPACIECSARVALMPEGVAVAGTFQGDLDVAPGGPGPLGSAGGSDVFVTSLIPEAAAFSEVKTKGFGDAAQQLAASVATDEAGNIFVAGSFGGTLNMGAGGKTKNSTGGLDAFAAKLDATVAPQWLAVFGGGPTADQQATAIALGSSLAVVGDFAEVLDPGGAPLKSAGDNDVFLLALDPATGAVLMAESFGGVGVDHAAGVAIDGPSNAIIAGVISGPASFACGMLGGSGKSIFVAKRPIP